ncbi:MAG TPA: hypothetical protein VKU36_05335 [Candidatus Babeliales bacterium]|nr:hypothetical protein [Candidatus Babeliales bacterium]
MKNIKNTSFILVVVALLSVTQASMAMMRVNFEIYNKSKNTIKVNVDGEEALVSPMKQYPQTFTNVNRSIHIDIYPNASSYEVKKFIITTQGKTIYLSWNPAKRPSLYPETGPWLGLLGITQSGLRLVKEKNVKPEEIIPLN